MLYRPPLRRDTWLLWAGPFLLVGAGLVALAVVLRRRQAASPAAAAPDPEALTRARTLLGGDRASGDGAS